MNLIYQNIIVPFSMWLKATDLSWAATNYPWIWPLCETLHFMGMTLLMGTVGLLDLRMLGFFRGLPIAPLHKLVPFGVAGFVVNAVTGFVFFSGDPFQYIENVSWWYKLAFIGVAGVNMVAFYATGVFRAVEATGADEEVPTLARIIAGGSICSWLLVMYFGRMLPFLGNAF